MRGLPNLQRNAEWGEARSKAQSDFSRGGLRTLSRRGSGVRIPSPAPFHGTPALPVEALTPELTTSIFQHAYWMQKQGYRPSTVRAAVKTLRAVGRRCDFLDPETFKDYLSKAKYGENRRDKILGDVDRLYKQLGIKWYRPISRRVETLPFIPLEAIPCSYLCMRVSGSL